MTENELITDTTTEEKLYLECDAGCEILACTELTDLMENNGVNYIHQEFYFAFFSKGLYNGRQSLWRRIKYAAYVLWTGKAHKDSIVLSPDKIKQLVDFLTLNLNKHERVRQGSTSVI